MRVDVAKLGADAVAFGLHKGLNTPAGLGAVWCDPSFMGASGANSASSASVAGAASAASAASAAGTAKVAGRGSTSGVLPLTPAFQSFSNAPFSTLLASLSSPSPPTYWPDARRFDGGNGNYFSLSCLSAYLDTLSSLGGIGAVEDYLRGLTQLLRRRLAERQELSGRVGVVTRGEEHAASPHSVVLALDDGGEGEEVDWKEYL